MRILTLFLLLFPLLAFADDQPQATGLGLVADNMLQVVFIVSDFIDTASIILGMCLLMASLLKYMQYRVNPLAVPISTIIVLFIIGIVLLLLPFIYKLTESGIPYHY
jgi:RsiW-degrading membrane proteinase PrsW (M82 family)